MLVEMLAVMPGGLFVFDEAGQVVLANPEGRRLFAPDDETRSAGEMLNVLDPQARAVLLVHLKAVRETGEPQSCALSFSTPGGERRYLHVRSAPLAGRAGWCCSVISDETDRQRATDAAEAARRELEADLRAREAFVARLSHELRSPLASMAGFADLVRQHVDAEGREMADLIRFSGQHVLQTLNAVLDLARLDVRGEEVERQPVEVVGRVRDTVAAFQPLARQRGLTLQWRPDSEEALAELNPIFLDRIVHNLIDNAIKYTEQGRVEVSVEQRDGYVWIYVADTGVGIDSSFMPRLFTPFERERTASVRGAAGVGLGLTLTKSLVERMGGHIYACSTKGEGSTFTVRFPVPSS